MANREQWSGLQIEDRCVRKEKLDASMKGKEIVPFNRLASLLPGGRDQVIFGVMYAPLRGPSKDLLGEVKAEIMLTDLDRNEPPKTLKLILMGRAMDHWADKTGAGRAQCVKGSLFAILNPIASKKHGGILATFETQVLKLGSCPSLGVCDAKDHQGLDCGIPFNRESGQDYCHRHVNMSHTERRQEMENRGRPVARPKLPGTAASQKRPRTASAEENKGKFPSVSDPLKQKISPSLTSRLPNSAAGGTGGGGTGVGGFGGAAIATTAAAAAAAAPAKVGGVGSSKPSVATSGPSSSSASSSAPPPTAAPSGRFKEAWAKEAQRQGFGAAGIAPEAVEAVSKAALRGPPKEEGSREANGELCRHLRKLSELSEPEMARLLTHGTRNLYEDVGTLVARVDQVGQLARQLRRRWRAILDDRGVVGQVVNHCSSELPIAKRARKL